MTRLPAGTQLRLLDRDDGDALLDLHRCCPLEGQVAFRFDRGPEFFRWADLAFDRWTYAGVVSDSRLVASGGFFLRTGIDGTGSDRSTICYLGDLRVHPSWRGHRLGERILGALAEHIPPEVTTAYAFVKEGNTAAEYLLAGTGQRGWTAARPLGCTTVSLLPALPPRRRGTCLVRPVGPDDLAEVGAFLAGAAGGRLLAPRITTAWLVRWWRLGGRQDPDSRTWLVAERDGRLVGALLLVDATSLKRTVLIDRTPGMRLLSGVHAVLSAQRGGPPLPGPGGALRARAAVAWAAVDDDPGIARELLAAAAATPGCRRQHLLQVALPDGDPLLAAVRGVVRQRFRGRLIVWTRDRTTGTPGALDRDGDGTGAAVETRRPWIDPVSL
ncbi:MAG: GNAT family N-acetyltransferase [Actinomycetales bacterium]|nr:GNAT family N-acetyltransferase [Actinomycetales bacterium]